MKAALSAELTSFNFRQNPSCAYESTGNSLLRQHFLRQNSIFREFLLFFVKNGVPSSATFGTFPGDIRRQALSHHRDNTDFIPFISTFPLLYLGNLPMAFFWKFYLIPRIEIENTSEWTSELHKPSSMRREATKYPLLAA